jgi:hypothetical protein
VVIIIKRYIIYILISLSLMPACNLIYTYHDKPVLKALISLSAWVVFAYFSSFYSIRLHKKLLLSDVNFTFGYHFLCCLKFSKISSMTKIFDSQFKSHVYFILLSGTIKYKNLIKDVYFSLRST